MFGNDIDISDCECLAQHLVERSDDSDFLRVCRKALVMAIMDDATDALQVVLKHCPPNTLIDHDLERAASTGKHLALTILLPYYTDDLDGALGLNVLTWAAKRGHLECLKACRDYISNKDSWFNALAQVCMYGHSSCLSFLLTKADGRELSSRVLNLALQYKHYDIAQNLLDCGAVDGQAAYEDAQGDAFCGNLPKLEELMTPIWMRERLRLRLSEETRNKDDTPVVQRKI